ncbi:MAG: transporter substrate-binding domain-containing protein [Deltaproteobacteria bacterium]|jgi:PAS domain S-box-containing protein|nr:transporter substrate-binding domain-containing protein [Deltaproteobacteria bacterium]
MDFVSMNSKHGIVKRCFFLAAISMLLIPLYSYGDTKNREQSDARDTLIQEKQLTTIIVDNYYPYTFVNQNGDPDGFSVDLIKAVAQEMGLKLKIHVDSWDLARNALKDGSIDVLPMMAYSSERDRQFDFSVPHTIAYDAFFTKNDATKIRSLDDLRGKKIIVMKGDQAHDYLLSTELIGPEQLVLVDSLPDALRLLSSGKGDAALMPKLVGLIAAKNLKFSTLELSPIVIEAYNRPFSFAVAEGNLALLERLSQGLSIVKTSDQYSNIYKKWFGALEPPGLSLRTVLKYIGGIILAFILIGSVLLLWSFSLKRQVALRTMSLGEEIEERKQAQGELKESEAKFRSFAEQSLVGIYLISDDVFKYVNPKFAEIFGYSVDECLNNMQFSQLVLPEDLATVQEQVGRRLSGENKAVRYSFSGIKKSGETIHVEIFGSSMVLTGKIVVTGTMLDITKRIDAENALKESEARLKKAQSVAKLGNWEYDISTGKVWGSEQAFRIYGIERTSPYLPLDRVEACIPDAPRVNQALVDLIQENKPYDMEFEVHQEVSRQTILIYSIAELIYENGLPIKVLGVIRDVTEQKKEEKERKQLEDQLQHAQKMEAIGMLAGGVAHDLNNILGGLVSYPELLLLQLPDDSPLRKSILTIQKSGEKAAAVVQDLLTLARRGVAVTEVVNLSHVVDEYLESPEHEKLQSYHPGVHIKTRLEKDTLNILGSSTHLSKTVMNLVSNAAEAIPEGGALTVSTENRYIDRPIRGYDDVKEGDYVVLTVTDTGTGISPDDMEKIFEPFYTKKKMGRSGTGLGMAVVWGTVKDHNGYIHARSTEGKGTTFTLYFPLTRKSLEERSDISLKDYMGKGEAILIVDDVEEQRKIASGMLKELGYSVVSVPSGEEAVEYLKTHKADLLVLDMIMDPGMDGLDTYRKIIEIHPEQKAIIASGFSETDRAKELQHLGARAYIRKPFLLEKIGLAVKEELAK